ncbi:helix-turn-helix transcriptional regulator [Ruegeria sp.]|uniref:helix-turn-helix transcriptional regulator n=1 Tax=Ruegeria sp. TaxID=1879320 RepID=UPI0023175CE4|nr:helix-turn-helix transcriptional regulator [Ruegeria sp.]MDA7965585.1 helix-turn-helix transcriptional regulator [Ruegeria sp.]
MSDIFPPRPLPRDPVAALVATLRTPEFPDALMTYIRQAAEIANFGAFYVADMNKPVPVLSIWGGEMSSYWFNRNARTILANDDLVADTVRRIRSAGKGELAIERWRPDPADPRTPIYIRDEVIERVTVSSRSGRIGLMSFFLRGRESGWLQHDEMERLQAILPIVHELIGLRHYVVGSSAFQLSPKARVSGLRHRDAGSFGMLSPREAEVCDMLVQGVGVSGTALELGVSENTVRTLRRRAYEKLGVHSATQIAALIMNIEAGMDGGVPPST